jgi:3-hydroxyacyl-[acyl-carrier-protein] dehydratase
MIVNSDEIKNLLPHRDPFLLVDKCEIIEVGIKGVGYRKFLPNEFFFKGHFPKLPIVPGVILIEALAQTAGIVVSKVFDNEKEKSVLFMSVSNAKFRKPVLPNEDISFEVEKLNNVKSVYKFYGLAKNNSTKVCEAKFSAMIINKSYSEIF